jgi:transcriptional regulator with XRE-family HTH domain
VGRRSSTHNDPPEADQRNTVMKQATRAEFGRRLNAQLVKNGWTQAEFARRAEAKAPKGMRIGTDSISHYINGRYLPSPSHVKVMAEALGVDPRELLPAKGVAEVGESLPPIGVQDLNNGTAWLRVNQAVPWPLAVKVLSLLRGEE